MDEIIRLIRNTESEDRGIKMEFKKYEEMQGVWREKEMEYLRESGLTNPSVKWNVTEKVHGANFSFLISENEIKYAKRSKIIKEYESFFNFQILFIIINLIIDGYFIFRSPLSKQKI